jgi:hypothetical protein
VRHLAALFFVGLLLPLVAAADQADDKKVKQAAVAFMKAVKAKDIDAVMKTVDVPFMTTERATAKVMDKVEDLRADLNGKLEKIKDVDKIPVEAAEVLELGAIRKKLEDRKKDDVLKAIEKVLGDKGCIVLLQRDGRKTGGLLVRVKDGAPKVVGIAD